jgi:hypothetical protein
LASANQKALQLVFRFIVDDRIVAVITERLAEAREWLNEIDRIESRQELSLLAG